MTTNLLDQHADAARELINRRKQFTRYSQAYAAVPTAHFFNLMNESALLLQVSFTNVEDLAARINQV